MTAAKDIARLRRQRERMERKRQSQEAARIGLAMFILWIGCLATALLYGLLA